MTEASSPAKSPRFQRARKPEERQIRRDAILAAAAALFDAGGAAGAGLNAIAAKAGFTKSNVYRYFESREAVLISLFLDEFEALVAGMEEGLPRCPKGQVDPVAEFCAGQFLARPRLCQLISILASVLEENVSEELIVSLKRAVRGLSQRAAIALHRALPQIKLADCAWGGGMIGTLVAGLWPSAHPGAVGAKVSAMPEFAGLKPQADRDLARAIAVLFKGLTLERAPGSPPESGSPSPAR
jgi:TetR/AcrR family transcriptional regulator